MVGEYSLNEIKFNDNELSALLFGAKEILKYQDFEKAAHAIFDICKELIGASSGYVALLSDDGSENEVLFLDAGGLPCTVNPALPMPIRGLRGDAYRLGKTVFDNNFEKSEWMQFMPDGHVVLHNVLFAPLISGGNTVGLMGLANKKEGFTERDAKIASAFGEFAAIALNNSKMLAQIEIHEKQLEQKIHDLKKFNDIMLKREQRVVELKKEINELLVHYGEAPRYA